MIGRCKLVISAPYQNITVSLLVNLERSPFCSLAILHFKYDSVKAHWFEAETPRKLFQNALIFPQLTVYIQSSSAEDLQIETFWNYIFVVFATRKFTNGLPTCLHMLACFLLLSFFNRTGHMLPGYKQYWNLCE